MSSEERFWAKVNVTDECWLWTAQINQNGYGMFSVKGLPVRAHRFAYELLVGPIPDGMVVRHACDVPSCVNPSHLLVGTQADNLRDMRQRGRDWASKMTHCVNGHPYEGKNVGYSSHGGRRCLECNRIAQRKAYRLRGRADRRSA